MDEISKAMINELKISMKAEMQELKEENVSLKMEMKSLVKEIQDVKGEMAKFNCASPERPMFTLLSDERSDVSFMTQKEILELQKVANFKLELSDLGWIYKEGCFPRFFNCRGSGGDFREGDVFTTPLPGRYRFKVSGRTYGFGKTEWYICCDNPTDDDESKRRKKILDLKDEYKSFENETRKLIATLDNTNTEKEFSNFTVFFGMELGRHSSVWLEVLKISGDFESAYCDFSSEIVV